MTNTSAPPVFVSTDDFQALSSLGQMLEGATAPGPVLLAAEIGRLSVVEDPKAGAPFVRIGSRVTYCDVQRRRVRTARVVMPAGSPPAPGLRLRRCSKIRPVRM